jgi:ESS family glutamate:Na+ symporter
MFLDFGLMSILLVAAHLLRSRVRLLQNLYVPTAVLAGFLGLIGDRQIVGIVPFSKNSEGVELIGTYPAVLGVILFATLFMGYREKQPTLRMVMANVADTFFYNLASELGLYGLALLIGLAVLPVLFPGLNPGFALMLPAGFAGGHNTSTVVGGVLREHGWKDALSIGYTFATVGLLAGTFGGMVLVNVGVRRGWAHLIQTPNDLSGSARTGFLPPEERGSLGQETVSLNALDPLAWHVALVLVAYAAAVLLDSGTRAWLPGMPAMPLFALSMLAGALIQKVLNVAGLGIYVDRQVIVRIGSAVSDYLIAFGIVSIQLAVVVEYLLPLALMCLFGVVYSVVIFWFVGRKLFRNFWFERSLFVYGWNTGVVGTSIFLLRIVDGKFRSRTLEDYGLAYVAIGPIEIALLVSVPPLVAHGIILVPALVLVAATLACVLLSCALVGWFGEPPTRLRAGEAEIVEKSRGDLVHTGESNQEDGGQPEDSRSQEAVFGEHLVEPVDPAALGKLRKQPKGRRGL